MSKIISLYQRLTINRISFETGDRTVKAQCLVQLPNAEPSPVLLVISHTDMNRIFARLSAAGLEYGESGTEIPLPDEDTSVFDYSFQNVFGQEIVLENFQFMNQVKEIRA